MRARSEAGNKHLLVIVDRASKFLFAYPLPNKIAENVAKKLLDLLLNYGISLTLRSDPGTEFTQEVVQDLCKWLNATIDMALQTIQELRGLWRGWEGGSMKPPWSFARVSLGDEMNTYGRPSSCIGQSPTLGYQARPPAFACYSAETAVPRWTPSLLAPTTRTRTDYTISSPTRVRISVKYRKCAKTCSIATSRDAADENTKTQGSDAPLPEPE